MSTKKFAYVVRAADGTEYPYTVNLPEDAWVGDLINEVLDKFKSIFKDGFYLVHVRKEEFDETKTYSWPVKVKAKLIDVLPDGDCELVFDMPSTEELNIEETSDIESLERVLQRSVPKSAWAMFDFPSRRIAKAKLMNAMDNFDACCVLLTGRRGAGKTTLGEVVLTARDVDNFVRVSITLSDVEHCVQLFERQLRRLIPDISIPNIAHLSPALIRVVDAGGYAVLQHYKLPQNVPTKGAGGGLILASSYVSQTVDPKWSEGQAILSTRGAIKPKDLSGAFIEVGPLKLVDLLQIFARFGVQKPRSMVRFVTMFGGVIDYYRQLCERDLLSDEVLDLKTWLVTLCETKSYQPSMFHDAEKNFLGELGSRLSAILNLLSDDSAAKNYTTKTLNADLVAKMNVQMTDHNLNTSMKILSDDLGLVEALKPMFFTAKDPKFRFRVIDHFLKTYQTVFARLIATKPSLKYNTAVEVIATMEGFTFGDMCRECIETATNSKVDLLLPWDLSEYTIGTGYWTVPDVEIDLVLVNEREKSIIFGSLKLTQKLFRNAGNLVDHIVRFHAAAQFNRGDVTWQHRLLHIVAEDLEDDGDTTSSTVASEGLTNKRSHDKIDGEDSEEGPNRHGTDHPAAGGGGSSTSPSSAPPQKKKRSTSHSKGWLSLDGSRLGFSDEYQYEPNMHTKSTLGGEDGMDGHTNGAGHDGVLGGPRKFRSARDQELVRLMVQSLQDLGLSESASTLQRESGYELESPTVSKFRAGVLSGNWSLVEGLLSSLDISSKNLKTVQYLIKQQKYLETLQTRDTKAALIILRQELMPLSTNRDRLHELASEHELKQLADWDGIEGSSREQLLNELQKYISSAVMIPTHRLDTLLDQALRYQKLGCLYHNVEDSSLSLFIDHACNKHHFPSTTTHVFEEHADEVWFVSFSNNGLYLASASKDATAIIWDMENYSSTYTLSGHTQAISYLAWSPDDSLLLTGSNDQTLKLWNTSSGTQENSFIRHSDTINSVAWLPDGERFISGSVDKHIYLWNVDGDVLYKWSGVRVMDLAITADGLGMVVISEKMIRLYDLDSKEEMASMSETDSITSVKIANDGRHALVNLSSQEIHLWDLIEHRMVRRYAGQKQGRFVIRSCFGGIDQNFVLSGSEDSHVYIWSREQNALLEVLPGHTGKEIPIMILHKSCKLMSMSDCVGCINCVAWNAQRNIFATASDDHTIRIWGLKPADA
ncbi:hypothetical protein HK097_004741 [Rhizophlyctis rosea]|uniref:TPR1-like CTLH-containing domain-containing protein n=1 Tax=Rhizophlyctis rosea TaxID=64517 RepID=A0AAD5SFF9_9FUNG|nr:hypothetical protein HK097_004741 [Rhizophlyctis rosea]